MRRRPCLYGPPCINASRRSIARITRDSLAVYGGIMAERDARSRANMRSQNNPPALQSRTSLDVYDLYNNNKQVTIDLENVEPFSKSFALLPRSYRIEVERRRLVKTLRERQSAAYDVVRAEQDDGSIQPDPQVVEEYLDKFLKDRRTKTDIAPSAARTEVYLRLAKEKALEIEQRRVRFGQAEAHAASELSFEAQWRRRETYGNFLLELRKRKILTTRGKCP